MASLGKNPLANPRAPRYETGSVKRPGPPSGGTAAFLRFPAEDSLAVKAAPPLPDCGGRRGYFFKTVYRGLTFRFLMEYRKMPRNSAATAVPAG